jgi:hypothetical protein
MQQLPLFHATILTNEKGQNHFSAMFADHENMPDRETLRIPNDYTTDPQAEVLVLEPVEPKYFIDVIVDEKRKLNDRQLLMKLIEPYRKQIGFFIIPSIFIPAMTMHTGR